MPYRTTAFGDKGSSTSHQKQAQCLHLQCPKNKRVDLVLRTPCPRLLGSHMVWCMNWVQRKIFLLLMQWGSVGRVFVFERSESSLRMAGLELRSIPDEVVCFSKFGIRVFPVLYCIRTGVTNIASSCLPNSNLTRDQRQRETSQWAFVPSQICLTIGNNALFQCPPRSVSILLTSALTGSKQTKMSQQETPRWS